MSGRNQAAVITWHEAWWQQRLRAAETFFSNNQPKDVSGCRDLSWTDHEVDLTFRELLWGCLQTGSCCSLVPLTPSLALFPFALVNPHKTDKTIKEVRL